MKIAILSDIHDHVWNLAAALQSVQDHDVMICCGDMCSPFIVSQMAKSFTGPIHIVFGNNDGDLFRITLQAKGYAHVKLHGSFFQGEFGGVRLAANHYSNIARALVNSPDFDVICFGHNHSYQIETIGNTLVINPGTLMGYDPLSGKDIPATFVVYDTDLKSASGFQITLPTGDASKVGKVTPYPA